MFLLTMITRQFTEKFKPILRLFNEPVTSTLCQQYHSIELKDRSVMASTELNCKAGHGGRGFSRCDGVGGNGGCIYFVARNGVSFKNFVRNYPFKSVYAGNGEDSNKIRSLGRPGVNKEVAVPIGTSLIDQVTGCKIAELNHDGEYSVVANGGVGGTLDNNFIGGRGEKKSVAVELTKLADIGLIGFRGSGKTQLLRQLSTCSPYAKKDGDSIIQMGNINFYDGSNLSVAKIDGIQGHGKKFGLLEPNFLGQISRIRLIAFVIDMFGQKQTAEYARQTAVDQVLALNKCVEDIDEFFEKPCMLLLDKLLPTYTPRELLTIQSTLMNLEGVMGNVSDHMKPERLLKFCRIIPTMDKQPWKVARLRHTFRETIELNGKPLIRKPQHRYIPDIDQWNGEWEEENDSPIIVPSSYDQLITDQTPSPPPTLPEVTKCLQAHESILTA